MPFQQPLATFVEVHLVEHWEDWERVSLEVATGLSKLQGPVCNILARISSVISEDELAACTLTVSKTAQRLHALSTAEDCLPQLGRDPRTSIVGPFVTEILQQVIPGSQSHFEPLYARAVYPCQANSSAVAWSFPHNGRATSVLTFPIPLAKLSLPQTPHYAFDALGCSCCGDARKAARARGSPRDMPPRIGDVVHSDPPTSISASLLPGEDRHPYVNAHLLFRQRPHDRIPFALLCVAEEEEMYSLMCSALMQRRVFGVDTPLFGFAFSSRESTLQLVIGWLEAGCTRTCVQVHVAHARPSQTSNCPPLGIFDLSDCGSAWSLVLFLISSKHLISGCAKAARKHMARTRCFLLSPDNATWRIDLTREAEGIATEGLDYDQRVRHWLDGCISMRSRSLTPPMASSPIISESEAEEARPTVSERGSRATSYAGSLCTIAEDPNDDLWVEPELKAQYEALLAQQNRVAPVAVLVHRRKAKSASSVAKDCSKQRVDRPTELFLDRGVVFGAFPPFWRGLKKEHPMWRVKDLLLRRLCDVEPLPRESLNESHPLITKFDVARNCFERSAPQGGDYVILRPAYVNQWYAYHQEKALEQVVRTAHKLYRLCPLDEGPSPSVTRKLIIRGLPHLLHVSELVSLGFHFIEDPIEMENRHSWDAVIDIYLNRRLSECPDALHDGTRYHVHNRLERRINLPRNILFELMKQFKASSVAPNVARPGTDLQATVVEDYYTGQPVDPTEPVEDDLSETPYTALSRLSTSDPSLAAGRGWTPSPDARILGEGSDQPLLDELVRAASEALKEDAKIVQTTLEKEKHWRELRALAYREPFLQDRDNAEGLIEARALCDFVYGVCDGLVFAEVPDVFDDRDQKLAKALQDFAIIGAPVEKGSRGKEQDEIQTEPSPDEPLPPSAPDIVRKIRKFAADLRQKSAIDMSEPVSREGRKSRAPVVPAAAQGPCPPVDLSHTSEGAGTHSGSAPSDMPITSVRPPPRAQESSAAGTKATTKKAGATKKATTKTKSRQAAKETTTKQPTATGKPTTTSKPATGTPPKEYGKMNWRSVCLPILFREYKRGFVGPLQGMNQARTYILSATDYYAAIDMYGIVVFAVATVGSKGRLLCGWAEPSTEEQQRASGLDVTHHIVDTNCPEWDLSNSSDAIDFAIFLSLLRTHHIPHVVEEFQKKRANFVAQWRDDAIRDRFNWSMLHQQKFSPAYKDAKNRKADQDKEYRVLQQQMKALLDENAKKKKARDNEGDAQGNEQEKKEDGGDAKDAKAGEDGDANETKEGEEKDEQDGGEDGEAGGADGNGKGAGGGEGEGEGEEKEEKEDEDTKALKATGKAKYAEQKAATAARLADHASRKADAQRAREADLKRLADDRAERLSNRSNQSAGR